MSTQNVTGKLCTQGPKGYLEVPLLTTITDDAALGSSEVFTDSNVTITSQSVGIYAENQVLMGGFISVKTGTYVAAIFNNGIVRASVPMYSRTSSASGGKDTTIFKKITLVPGDQLLVQVYA
ncbi:MAG: hypothetical protein CXX80_03350 [Methanobacteriota archaeon]|nr:MAG: hypothetical protein CXX80_09445 [Euryarchaeota archaeon]PXY76167.1 MAG: hypothetical protein CXX80_03350 [Euryarchaeota archaeon]